MIKIGKIYKSQEATKLTTLMDNFKIEEHSLLKSKSKPKSKSLKNKKVNRSFTIYNISKYLNCRELNNEGRYRASNHRNAAIKAFTNKTKNKEEPITNYITINESASGIVKTFKMSRDSMLKLNIESVETPVNCVRNSLKTKSKRKSKKQSKKNN
jgi:hypothetical protein